MRQGPFQPLVQYIRRLAAPAAPDAGSDAELLQRFIATRDQAAFAVLVERHAGVVLGVCHRVMRTTQGWDDLFQATFLVLARKAGSIGKLESLASWLHGVAFRIAVRARRQSERRRQHEKLETDMADPQPLETADAAFDPQHEAARRELYGVLDEELHRLPEKHRAPLVLCYMQGKSHEETARTLGCPLGSMAWRLEQAREKLRRGLSRRGVTLPAATLTLCLSVSASVRAAAPLMDDTVKAACAFVLELNPSAASASAADLARGVLRTMMLRRATIGGLCCLAAGLIGAGVLLSWPQTPIVAVAVAVPAEDKPAAVPVALPKEPQTPVITVREIGGLRPVRKFNDPELVVRADGSVTVNTGAELLKGQLSPAELQQIMQFIVQKNNYFDIDMAKLSDRVRTLPPPPDSVSAVVRIKTADKEHEVSFNTSTIGGRLPADKQLDELRAIQRRIKVIRWAVEAGGFQIFNANLDMAREAFRERFPDASTLSTDDLSYVNRDPKRGITIYFSRRGTDPDQVFGISVLTPIGGKPTVTISSNK